MKFSFRYLNRLSQKFILGVALILILMSIGTLFINSQIVERYYLHEQREYVRKIGLQLEEKIEEGTSAQEAIEEIEKKENVLIVYSEKTKDVDILANKLRDNFRQKGLGFQRFWLWEQDYETAIQNGSQFRLYSQNKMNYNILVQYLPLNSRLYAIAAIVPIASGFIKIINRISFLIYSLSIFVSIVLIFILIKHITNPLNEIRAFTKRISLHQYEPLEISTGDELEDVAKSLNEMGYDINQYQKILELKNEQMKQLLNDVTHDLKTPISLISMYASGIKDGLDDGTFLDTIIEQNNKISQIVESLLHLSRIELKKHPYTKIKLDQLLLQCINEQIIFFENRKLELHQQIEPNLNLTGNTKLITELFSNLLSNAAKYASYGSVQVKLYLEGQNIFFNISNKTDNTNLDITHIWQPFYVGEGSRNKILSGTGLGLSIVKKIAEQFGYLITCKLEGENISFEIIFHKMIE